MKLPSYSFAGKRYGSYARLKAAVNRMPGVTGSSMNDAGGRFTVQAWGGETVYHVTRHPNVIVIA